MKHFRLKLLLTILPLTALADGNHKTIELSEMTKNSMKRTAIVSTDSNESMVFDTRNGYRSTTFVRINKDGTKESLCTTSIAEAKKFMLGEIDSSKSEGE